MKIRATQSVTQTTLAVTSDFVFIGLDGTPQLIKAGTVFDMPMPTGPIAFDVIDD